MKQYVLTVTVNDEGDLSMNAQNDGFNAFELIGIFEHRKEDILKQLAGEVKPDIIKREVIND